MWNKVRKAGIAAWAVLVVALGVSPAHDNWLWFWLVLCLGLAAILLWVLVIEPRLNDQPLGSPRETDEKAHAAFEDIGGRGNVWEDNTHIGSGPSFRDTGGRDNTWRQNRSITPPDQPPEPTWLDA